MKNLYLKAGNTQDVFNNLKDSLKGTLLSDNNEFKLALESDIARGNIEGITFPEGMTFMQFDMVFSDDVRMSMELSNKSPIFFTYCSEGNFQHSYGVQGERKSLKKNYTGIFKSSTNVNNILYFEKNVPTKFSVIGIPTKNTHNKQNDVLIKKLQNTFFNNNKDCLHINLQIIKISQEIEKFNSMKQIGMGRNLLKNSILENILEMEIEQYSNSFSDLSQAVRAFKVKKIAEIKGASNLITNFLFELSTTKFFRKVNGFLILIRVEKQRI
ncbi:MAG: hypothetical protein GZ087_06030 [Flavobacterium sp.]|nr:hypothetical protein [Flavobacterium sp.]